MISLELDKRPKLVWIVSSVSEDKIQVVVKKSHGKFQEYVDDYFVRGYPLGLRFDSSNYDPFLSWIAGAQLDLFMLLNYGMFLNSSYILKSKQDIKMTILINIISASNLVWEEEKSRQEETVDPYIKVRIAGNKDDVNKSQKWRTEVIQDSGQRPIQNNHCIIQLKYAQQDLFYFRRPFPGLILLITSQLKKGYRIIPLLNSQFKPLFNSQILVHIKIYY